MKKFGRLLLFLLIGIFFIYLVLPDPEFAPLGDSLLSDEPGDTVEISGVWAYYTNTSRAEVLDFYKNQFSHSSFLGLPLPVVILNHPPEYGREAIRDTTETTFLYELVHPFRDSLYINGFDPAESPKYVNANHAEVLEIKDRFWARKVILRHRTTSVLARIAVFGGIIFLIWIVGWHLVVIVKGFFPKGKK